MLQSYAASRLNEIDEFMQQRLMMVHLLFNREPGFIRG